MSARDVTPEWDWTAQGRALGVGADGSFNAGLLHLGADPAVIWHREDGSTHRYSGAALMRRAGEIAGVLSALGVGRGDRVAGLISRRPAVFATALAVWRLGAVYVPLFSGFGGDGLRVRLVDSGPKVVVTDPANRANLAAVQDVLPDLRTLMVGGAGEPGDALLDDMINRLNGVPAPVATGLHETSTIMYTSGTTGRPKGCLIPHRAVLSLLPYVRYCLGVGPGDVLFSGADAGWSFGLFTTGLAPMSQGVSRVVYEGPFSAEGWWSCVRAVDAGHVAAAPTAFRQLAAAGAKLVPPGFRAATSAGEPLDAATVDWFDRTVGVVVHDSYGLSELGMVTGNLRHPGAPAVAPGSMGVALPGFEVELLDPDGSPVRGPGEGRVAVRDNGYFLSAGYWGREDEWAARFADGWFLTEDLARRDEEGRYWYVGRADDVIVSAGYNVGPVEVETVLLEHPLVVDAACVGEPDPVKGQVVAAHIVLADAGTTPRPEDLLRELRTWVGQRVGWHAAPRRLHLHPAIPRTATGKVQRRALREGGNRW
ncbi:acyl-CoA synthetase [Micromonospora sp. NPDC047740]|uniref:acyl-CoA synthetase n=1 Tax=Micromonospora sp. NPDC047740 TaxID=3364254 RepID=UPI003711EFBF